jgi:glycosyltransferase involved in cell wall biosynthesis
MDEPGQISVILPVFNCEPFLADAINSAISQICPPAEVIVIDDGSTDKSAAVAQGFPLVRLLSQPHSGVSVARNRGVEAAKGDFLAFLDSDDLWLPEKLARQIAAFQNNPYLDMIFCHVDEFYSLNSNETTSFRETKQNAPGYIPSSMMIRKNAFLEIGLFDPNRQIAEFFDWYIRAQEKGLHSALLPEVLVKRRLHGNNLGIRQHEQQTEYLQIAKALLDRRRSTRKVPPK